jgi:hypothetical protein
MGFDLSRGLYRLAMAGLAPAIHVLAASQNVDARII